MTEISQITEGLDDTIFIKGLWQGKVE